MEILVLTFPNPKTNMLNPHFYERKTLTVWHSDLCQQMATDTDTQLTQEITLYMWNALNSYAFKLFYFTITNFDSIKKISEE
jgi:hypothetical protein